MYRCAHYRTGHHGLGLTETKICQGTSVVAIQLEQRETIMRERETILRERERWEGTYQYILQLDIPMQKTLAMQKPNSLDHVQCNLHSRAKVYTDFERCVEISGIAWHEEEHHGTGAVGVVIIDQGPYQIDNSIVTW